MNRTPKRRLSRRATLDSHAAETALSLVLAMFSRLMMHYLIARTRAAHSCCCTCRVLSCNGRLEPRARTSRSVASRGRRGALTVLHLMVAASCAAVLLLTAASASADSRKRDVPNYTGLRETTSAGDALIWIPRIALSPLYLVSEYGVRRPLGFLISEAERAKLPQFLYSLFFFGPDREAALLPVAFVDFGFYPSVGLYFFWKDELRIRAATWGADWLSGSISGRLKIAPDTALVLHATGTRRPEYRYFGVGADSRRADATRYGASRYEVGAKLELKLGGLSIFSVDMGFRRVHFHRGEGFDGDPRLDDQIARGRVSAPAGYVAGYGLLYNRVALVLDSRAPRPASQSGVRFELQGELMSRVLPRAAASFARYGATAGASWDIGHTGRVLSFAVSALFVDPVQGGEAVPFTELAALGGDDRMRGFQPGRLFGRSSAVVSLRYRWPIAVWLDGSLQLAAGNVFDAQLRDLSPNRLRLSGAIGVESTGAPDSSLEILLGAGTETFAQGTQISSVRAIVGTNHGF